MMEDTGTSFSLISTKTWHGVGKMKSEGMLSGILYSSQRIQQFDASLSHALWEHKLISVIKQVAAADGCSCFLSHDLLKKARVR